MASTKLVSKASARGASKIKSSLSLLRSTAALIKTKSPIEKLSVNDCYALALAYINEAQTIVRAAASKSKKRRGA